MRLAAASKYFQGKTLRVCLFLIKATDALISQIYFCQETLHVSGSSYAHHQEFSTVHSALVYVIKPV
jgi:hypothetical protein